MKSGNRLGSLFGRIWIGRGESGGKGKKRFIENGKVEKIHAVEEDRMAKRREIRIRSRFPEVERADTVLRNVSAVAER